MSRRKQLTIVSAAVVVGTAALTATVFRGQGSAGAVRTANGVPAAAAALPTTPQGATGPGVTHVDVMPAPGGTARIQGTTFMTGTTSTVPPSPSTTVPNDWTQTTGTTSSTVVIDPPRRRTPDRSACGPPNGVDRPQTQDAFEVRIEKAWLLCGAPSVFGTNEDGLEIRPDHRWSKLRLNGGGRLVRMHGPRNEGTWETIDTSSMNGPGYWQLNLHVDGWTVVTIPQFGAFNPVMRLDNNANFVADYIPAALAGISGP